ncbi:hypothetical protein [Planktothricoides sp. SR001]|nr:hypothetical protein [Planktothricoides sp. SR001]
MGVLYPTRCAAMDEERSQAYLSLIQELLTSPGEANKCELVAAQLPGV